MEQFVWLMDQLRVLAEWRSASMECGEQCVIMAGITMMPELCADNWGTMSTQVEVSSYIGKRIDDVTRDIDENTVFGDKQSLLDSI